MLAHLLEYLPCKKLRVIGSSTSAICVTCSTVWPSEPAIIERIDFDYDVAAVCRSRNKYANLFCSPPRSGKREYIYFLSYTRITIINSYRFLFWSIISVSLIWVKYEKLDPFGRGFVLTQIPSAGPDRSVLIRVYIYLVSVCILCVLFEWTRIRSAGKMLISRSGTRAFNSEPGEMFTILQYFTVDLWFRHVCAIYSTDEWVNWRKRCVLIIYICVCLIVSITVLKLSINEIRLLQTCVLK